MQNKWSLITHHFQISSCSVPKTYFANVYTSWHEAKQILLQKLPPIDFWVVHRPLNKASIRGVVHQRGHTISAAQWKFQRKGEAHMRENIRAVAAWRIQGNQQENERSPRIHSHNRQHHCSHPIPPSRPSRVQVGVGGARIMSPSLPRPTPSQVLYPLTSRTD